LDYGLAIANCAQLGVDPAKLSLWEYEAILWNHNEAHRSPDDIEAPDPEKAMALLERLNADPRLTGAAA
jgi:hypothetical protein